LRETFPFDRSIGSKADIMKLFKSTIAALAMASSSLFALSSHAEEGHRNCRANPGGEWPIDPAAYVVRNCAFCHGSSLQGLAVAPRLAGQHQDYIVYRLERFRHKEWNKYMSPVAVSMLPDSYCELGAYIATMPPEARSDGNEALAAEGEEIFRRGVPNDNIPACQFCHGPQAQGVGKFPRLGGQSYYYLKSRLEQWVEGYGTISPHMPGIASKLNPEQIDAVASYLSFLPAAPSPGEY
jgi:cytochrome c553